MIGIEKKIKVIKIFNTGYCQGNLKSIFKNTKKNIRQFCVNSVLLHHHEKGYILFDTGYHPRVNDNGIISFIYKKLAPFKCNETDTVAYQLKQLNIPLESIKYALISHAHPDHIGGLLDFKHCKIITSPRVLENFKKNKLRDLVFKNLYNQEIINNISTFNTNQIYNNHLSNYFDNQTFDIFDDNSLIAVNLEGHAKGQFGIYIKDCNLFLVADTVWGLDLIDKTIKYTGKFIQNDHKKYTQNINNLKKFIKDYPDTTILANHETVYLQDIKDNLKKQGNIIYD